MKIDRFALVACTGIIVTALIVTIFFPGPRRTILLFPYVTSASGFDTGIAIGSDDDIDIYQDNR